MSDNYSDKELKVYQLFASIDGEVNKWHQGALSIFIRLSGCNLRCRFCDTDYAQESASGTTFTIKEIMKLLRNPPFKDLKKITITGGEPLVQSENVLALCLVLIMEGYRVTIETNGSIRPFHIPGVSIVMDYKLPSSGMWEAMDYKNFDLRQGDFIKFVISDQYDFDIALKVVDDLKGRGCPAVFAFSPLMPVAGKPGLKPYELLDWMILNAFRIDDAILNVQLHKLIDLSEPIEPFEK